MCTLAKFPRPAISRKSCGHKGESTSKPVPISQSTSAARWKAYSSHTPQNMTNKSSYKKKRKCSNFNANLKLSNVQAQNPFLHPNCYILDSLNVACHPLKSEYWQEKRVIYYMHGTITGLRNRQRQSSFKLPN